MEILEFVIESKKMYVGSCYFFERNCTPVQRLKSGFDNLPNRCSLVRIAFESVIPTNFPFAGLQATPLFRGCAGFVSPSLRSTLIPRTRKLTTWEFLGHPTLGLRKFSFFERIPVKMILNQPSKIPRTSKLEFASMISSINRSTCSFIDFRFASRSIQIILKNTCHSIPG